MNRALDAAHQVVLGEATFPVLPLSWNQILALPARARMRTRREDKARWFALLLTDDGRRLPRGVRGVEIHVTCQGPRRRDPDNLHVKPLLDAMRVAGILPDDDSEVVTAVRLAYRRMPGAETQDTDSVGFGGRLTTPASSSPHSHAGPGGVFIADESTILVGVQSRFQSAGFLDLRSALAQGRLRP